MSRFAWSSLLSDVVGIFLGSLSSGFTAFPGGSSGNLCLDGPIGRFSRPSEIRFSGSQRGYYLDLDLTNFPSPTGATQVLNGETWYFQSWHRDMNPTSTSHFTDALEITF